MVDDAEAPLRSILLEVIAGPQASAAAAIAQLDSQLQALFDAAVVDNGDDFGVDVAAFVLYLAERLPEDVPCEQALSRVCAGDLLLAMACAMGHAKALAQLERRHGAAVARTLEGMRSRTISPDDLLQIVRQKLFVSASGPPLVTRYAGQGRLSAWLRVTAKRLGLNALRDGRERIDVEPDDDATEVADELADVELAVLKRDYHAQFREAFAAATARLPERGRTLLRLSVVEGVSVRRLGVLYGTHATTAARWLAAARRALIELTIEELGRRVEISSDDLAAAIKFIRSQLDLSITRLLE